MCPAFSLLAISEAVSQADISTEVGITGWNSVSWECPLPPPPWALGSSGAPALPSPSPGDRGVPWEPFPAQQHSHWAEGRHRSSAGASVREHRTQNITPEGTRGHVGKCCGTALQGLGKCNNHKAVCAFSPHSHWNSSQQSVWEEVFTGPFLRVINH